MKRTGSGVGGGSASSPRSTDGRGGRRSQSASAPASPERRGGGTTATVSFLGDVGAEAFSRAASPSSGAPLGGRRDTGSGAAPVPGSTATSRRASPSRGSRMVSLAPAPAPVVWALDDVSALARARALEASALVQRSAMDDVEAYYLREAQANAAKFVGPRSALARLLPPAAQAAGRPSPIGPSQFWPGREGFGGGA
mmetsp:Transcript_150095/g.482417  ORF Transcript_150095/g.482417 Transcript_150095/m.482417 type:complete len:197 (+) Transcript_150095:39-629(+)